MDDDELVYIANVEHFSQFVKKKKKKKKDLIHVVLCPAYMCIVQSWHDQTQRSGFTRPGQFNLHSWNKCSRKLNELYSFSSYWNLWLCLTRGSNSCSKALACSSMWTYSKVSLRSGLNIDLSFSVIIESWYIITFKIRCGIHYGRI